MARGGRRQGTSGAKYPNRTDMQLGPRKLAVTTAPNQPYGEAGAQAAAQQAVPMATAPMQPPMGDPQQAAMDFQPPPVTGLDAPTMNPSQPVTAMPAAPPAPPSPVLKGVALLNALGSQASPEVKALRAVLSAQQANEGAP
jgi:hypothetical protein